MGVCQCGPKLALQETSESCCRNEPAHTTGGSELLAPSITHDTQAQQLP